MYIFALLIRSAIYVKMQCSTLQMLALTFVRLWSSVKLWVKHLIMKSFSLKAAMLKIQKLNRWKNFWNFSFKSFELESDFLLTFLIHIGFFEEDRFSPINFAIPIFATFSRLFAVCAVTFHYAVSRLKHKKKNEDIEKMMRIYLQYYSSRFPQLFSRNGNEKVFPLFSHFFSF